MDFGAVPLGRFGWVTAVRKSSLLCYLPGNFVLRANVLLGVPRPNGCRLSILSILSFGLNPPSSSLLHFIRMNILTSGSEFRAQRVFDCCFRYTFNPGAWDRSKVQEVWMLWWIMSVIAINLLDGDNPIFS